MRWTIVEGGSTAVKAPRAAEVVANPSCAHRHRLVSEASTDPTIDDDDSTNCMAVGGYSTCEVCIYKFVFWASEET